MSKNHKRHIQLLLFLLAASMFSVDLFIIWEFGIINFPPAVTHYLRYASGRLAPIPVHEVELALPFHRQEHSLSCEAATLKMVLSYYGVGVSESEIIKKMPFDKTQKSNGVWGDPNKGFVGNIDGKMLQDGYGVYWGPLAETARNWKKAEIIEGGSTEMVIEHLLAGHPIIIWGYLGRGQPLKWRTPEGKEIYAINGEHTRVVYGFKGDPDSPDGFLVMDPVYGPAYWERAKFIRNWNAFGRSGVVIYP